MTGDLRDRIAENPVWYHTIELARGVETPGWFDLRPILGRMPWPDVTGKRCLDVGTYDGFLAFELERRGAAEVVATDLDEHEQWDWPVDVRAQGGARLAELAGPEKGRGFRIAKELLGSSVERVGISVYDLSPDELGEFDVVVCGSLLLHLRDPLRALEAIRSVCRGAFLSAEQINLRLSVLARRLPAARVMGTGELAQWWEPNVEGHRQLLRAGGFGLVECGRPYSIPFGASHPSIPWTPATVASRLVRRAMTGGFGVPHAAVLARPAV